MVSLNAIPLRNDSFAVREIGEETVFFADKGDELHTLNEIGAFIWNTIDGKRMLHEILDCIVDEYEVSKEIAEKDMLHFISELETKGIINFKQEK
ncbi:MAG: PqqD family protein [Candidatus Latescibacteria bacterium]|nr:PqqD family protein [Candidatus Latescibacterota bacterium]